MTLRNLWRWLALSCAVAASVAAFAPPASAAVTCRGQRATIVGSRGMDYLVGTPGADVIVGKTGLDQIYGRGGDDTICGGKGDDLVIAGDGGDSVYGDSGSDELFGDEGNDYLVAGPGRASVLAGGPGDDYLVGGDGLDIANFVNSDSPVAVDLATDTAGGEGADTLVDIDGAFGSRFNDRLVGDDRDNILVGAGGSDELQAGGNRGTLGLTPTTNGADILVGDGDPQSIPGDDMLTGGAGLTVADYSSARAGIQADLEAGSATGDGVDQLAHIQVIGGTPYADVLTGNEKDNAFRPYTGDDRIDGGAGLDTLVFTTARQGIAADVGTGIATGEGSDTFDDIESLWGGPRADHLVGDPDTNGLAGFRGNDRLVAREGDDFLGGGAGTDTLDGGPGIDYCYRGETNIGCEPGPRRGRVPSDLRITSTVWDWMRGYSVLPLWEDDWVRENLRRP